MMTERVVLDTNYYRGANIAVLEALRQRGFKLSLSAIAFMELGTRFYPSGTVYPAISCRS